MPEPPPYVSGYARQEWDRLANPLFQMGTLTLVDQSIFGAYCIAFGHWRQAEEDLERMARMDDSTHGTVLKTKEGNFIQNPLVGVANTFRRDMQRLAAEFGLSPSARTQIEARSREDDSILRKYGLL